MNDKDNLFDYLERLLAGSQLSLGMDGVATLCTRAKPTAVIECEAESVGKEANAVLPWKEIEGMNQRRLNATIQLRAERFSSTLGFTEPTG